jgi:hypothetical protein
MQVNTREFLPDNLNVKRLIKTQSESSDVERNRFAFFSRFFRILSISATPTPHKEVSSFVSRFCIERRVQFDFKDKADDAK